MRKFFATLLALVMVLGLMVPTAWAAGAGRIEIEPLVFVPWDGKITIGGTTLNTWFTKYGNTYCDCTVDHFTGTEDNGLGFEVGDVVTVKFLGKEIQLPVVTNYSDVDSGKGCIKVGGNQYVEMAINMGNFGNTYGLVEITKDGSGVYSVTPCGGVSFPVELTFEMYEKGGYLSEYLMHQLSRTNVRTDYADLSDAEFANFRQVTEHLYRGSSPVNPEIGRNTYADAALKKAGASVIMNLADSQAAAAAYPGFKDTYYADQNVIYLNLGVDFTAADFKAGLAKGMKFFADPAFEGKNFYVHCTEGKDRCGFVSALLECLMGVSADEVIKDYMVTYANYYGVKPGTEQYDAIANSNIVKSLCRAFDVTDLSKVDLQAKAKAYLKDLGLTDKEIVQLMVNLGDPVRTGDNGITVYFILADLALCAGAAMLLKRKEIF